MILARRVGAVVLAAAAVAGWFLVAPEGHETVTIEGVTDRTGSINQALSD